MPEDVRTCTLCGSNSSALFDQQTFRPIRRERGVALKRRIELFSRHIITRFFPQRAWLIRE